MRLTRLVCGGVLLTLILNGCPSPTVKYARISGPEHEGHIKFHLASSNILLATAQEDEKTGLVKVSPSTNVSSQSLSAIAATVVAKETKSSLYSMIPKSSWLWLVKTNLSATFQDNTRLLKTIGVAVEDNRLKAIQAVGAIAMAAVAAAAPPAPPRIRVPVVIDPYESTNTWQPLPSNEGNYEYIITFSPAEEASKEAAQARAPASQEAASPAVQAPAPALKEAPSPTIQAPAPAIKEAAPPERAPEDKDAIKSDVFFDEYGDNRWFNSTSVVPVSSCRSIVLKIRPTLEHMATEVTPRGQTETETAYNQRIKEIISTEISALKEKNKKEVSEKDNIYEKRITELALNKHTRIYPLQIADPHFVRTVRMPDKGSITLHSVCGADTKTESTEITGYQDLLAEAAKQAKAVWEAQKEKKEKAKEGAN